MMLRSVSVVRSMALAVLCAAVLPASSLAQQARGPRNHVHIDVQPGGIAVGYARALASGRAAGFELGAGGNVLEYMILAGSHFAEDGGITYDRRESDTGPMLFEVAAVSAFVRHRTGSRWQIDTGVRASAFFHFDDSDDDPGAGGFAGVYATTLWGGRRLRVGPRVMAGFFSEGTGKTEFGVHLSVLVGRVSLWW